MSAPDLLVIFLPVHNRGSLTAEFITHVEEDIYLPMQTKYVVLDDGCTDDTISNIQLICPKVEIIQLDGNAFWGGAINAVATYIKQFRPTNTNRIFYLLCNDDIRFISAAALNDAISKTQRSTVVCARLVETLDPTVRWTNLMIHKRIYSQPPIYYNCKKGLFRPARQMEAPNVSSTYAMLSTSDPWLSFGSVPTSIPHYLSDYWLTYHFYKAGFDLVLPDDFLCLTFITSTRNLPTARPRSSIHELILEYKRAASRSSTSYAPAWITFYAQTIPTLPVASAICKHLFKYFIGLFLIRIDLIAQHSKTALNSVFVWSK